MNKVKKILKKITSMIIEFCADFYKKRFVKKNEIDPEIFEVQMLYGSPPMENRSYKLKKIAKYISIPIIFLIGLIVCFIKGKN